MLVYVVMTRKPYLEHDMPLRAYTTEKKATKEVIKATKNPLSKGEYWTTSVMVEESLPENEIKLIEGEIDAETH